LAHQLARVILAIAVPVLAVTAATDAHAQTCTPPAVLTMLHSFDNNVGDPRSTVYPGIVAQGRDGNLYTTSFAGGQGSTADGTTFRVTPSGALTVLYSFDLFNFHSQGQATGGVVDSYQTSVLMELKARTAKYEMPPNSQSTRMRSIKAANKTS
jgi:uncharacterized repeat protein (TIGR03803 family)